MMGNKTMIALLCLGLCIRGFAQQASLQDSMLQTGHYVIEDSILITTKDNAKISALMVRRKDQAEPLPVIFQFTIYARKSDLRKAKDAADRGYVGVIAYTRGKRYSSGEIVPYVYDGRDAYDVIDWISKQTWCNGKVGMMGGSYNGFTQWAAAKKLHPALKTIVPSATAAPGIDVPMMNNVFMSFPFSWTYYVTNNKWLDNEDYNGSHWGNLLDQWFEIGTAYRSIDSLLGRGKNRVFQAWLDHPTYDAYWQAMIPYKHEFAKINIPVLTTTGYYDGGQVGALYYMREHKKYKPTAEHYLLIGPYGHFGSQGYPDAVYNGYAIDTAARVPIHQLIYQWFDYILKGQRKPEFLKDKVNYEVMGANIWRHAASLEKVSNDTLTLYLDQQHLPLLESARPREQRAAKMEVDFADRTTALHYYYNFRTIWDSLNDGGGVMYTSKPMEKETDLAGCFLGEMNVVINKKDMDYSLVLFEQMPDGRYFFLSYFMGRASHARSNVERHLLTPGKKATLPFVNSYFTSKRLQKGSRLVLIANVNKTPNEQINYGTGKDVSDETIRDAKEPLQVQWLNSSYIKVPILRMIN
jgi:uncharacterized protein